MKTLFIALRTAIFGTGFIFLWGWVALGLHHRYDIILGIALSDWTRVLGVAVMVVGGALAFACVATFVTRGEGTPAPFDPPRKFVAVGPYRYVRNPMYLGMAFALIGEAILFADRANLVRIIVYGITLIMIIMLFVLLHEEPALRRRFGFEYEAYCRTVP